MPTLKYKVPLEGQPDQIVGCEMFSREDLAKIPNQRGGLFFRVVEKGVYVDYAVPLVDTTDIRASRLRVKKASGTYALSKGDYADGTWVEKTDSEGVKLTRANLRTPQDGSGVNVRLTAHVSSPEWYQEPRAMSVWITQCTDVAGNVGSNTRQKVISSPTLQCWNSSWNSSYSFYAQYGFVLRWNHTNGCSLKVEVLE